MNDQNIARFWENYINKTITYNTPQKWHAGMCGILNSILRFILCWNWGSIQQIKSNSIFVKKAEILVLRTGNIDILGQCENTLQIYVKTGSDVHKNNAQQHIEGNFEFNYIRFNASPACGGVAYLRGGWPTCDMNSGIFMRLLSHYLIKLLFVDVFHQARHIFCNARVREQFATCNLP